MRVSLFVTCLMISLATACSVPNLDPKQCTEARPALKKFYSLHFGNGLEPSTESLERKRPFLTKGLFSQLESNSEPLFDYFTQTRDYPKAFRIGKCSPDSETRTRFGILLFWKDDTRDEQKEVEASVEKEGAKWLIAGVRSVKPD